MHVFLAGMNWKPILRETNTLIVLMLSLRLVLVSPIVSIAIVKTFSCDQGDYIWDWLHKRSLTSAKIGGITIAWIAMFHILLASLSLLRRKTAISEKIEGHELFSFIEGIPLGLKRLLVVGLRSTRRLGRSYENPRSLPIVSIAYDRLSIMQTNDAIETIGAIIWEPALTNNHREMNKLA